VEPTHHNPSEQLSTDHHRAAGRTDLGQESMFPVDFWGQYNDTFAEGPGPSRLSSSPVRARALLALQRSCGNQAVQQFVGRLADRASRSANQTFDQTAQRAPGSAPPATTTLDVAFYAFIPASLGKAFKDWPHPKDLKNQAAFDAKVAAVTGTWIPEPGNVFKRWYCATDDRGFGGGSSHRVGFVGKISTADIGVLGSKGVTFTHSCSPSHRVRAFDTGIFTSSNETGDVEGPLTRTATASGKDDKPVDSTDSSTIKTKGSAAYAFMEGVSPDIDYEVTWTFARAPGGKVNVSVGMTHNLFPFYEALVNGTVIYTYSATDPGPTISNLNRSRYYFVGPWPF
jgi:hypothetical protein